MLQHIKQRVRRNDFGDVQSRYARVSSENIPVQRNSAPNHRAIGHTGRKFQQVNLLGDFGVTQLIQRYPLQNDRALVIWERSNETAGSYSRWIECFKISVWFEKGQGQAEVAQVGMCVARSVGRKDDAWRLANTATHQCYDGRKNNTGRQ